jgi:hypothetical protein
LTNDALTDWGGGVAFFDTLVEVRPAGSTDSLSPAVTGP